MAKIERDDIYRITEHSDLNRSEVQALLQQHIYNQAGAWRKFLRLFFISLAAGFLAAGIIMFFAYNWASLGKFSKIGLIEILIAATVSLVLFSKMKDDIKNICLTAASVLVGVLFAVFGQIYQTGADAYDFFLGWTLSITLWVLVAGYAPLWLIYLLLINTTVVLYSQQVAGNWSDGLVYIILLIINLIALVTFIWLYEAKRLRMPSWFIKVLSIAVVLCATIGVTAGIFGRSGPAFLVLLLLTAVSYAAGLFYALKKKRAFYFSIIPFSLVVIISDLLLNIGSDAGMFFFTFAFVIVSVTLIIKNLLSLQKKWTVE